MAGKYGPLTDLLLAAAARNRAVVELGFEELAALVGGLPPSADVRQWWANNSQVQALAWRSAGYHVDQVYLDRRRVRFSAGAVGGTFHDRGRTAARASRPGPEPARQAAPEAPVVDVRVRFEWLAAGAVILDAAGKPAFGPLPAQPGLYRITIRAIDSRTRPRVYLGETDNLRRRLAGNYRSPGPRQQTSLRINALLRESLSTGCMVALATATEATVWCLDEERPLDLQRKAARLLAENAALVLAHRTNDADIENLG